ncbi:DNA processing chain A (dprA) [Helicobacter fennelliae]|uniref:Rossmann fold nucleotide-binding protein Smf n=2 Tax=Helicobacter fennelliae TaxID=215 RepID=T1CPT7_9HELI|nr:DNA-processing protein DprA [Helicobacter fennelliae]GAD18774.1 rossmann fold nucleotide-binding protein Smf [Helicobacter fennelliae MRY12-0050]SQB97435.1 DNA processing chain A (dprA) [Helicobacter fennelliae]STP07062.1 DNA processing chain A (dprA) [Helicobacter fennelliae]STQ83391.1 DNA processing chain A (dprA) [Helicobacter fennelliae]
MNSGFEAQSLSQIPHQFNILSTPPKQLFYTGDISLLDKSPKIAIIGTRKPNVYSKTLTSFLAKEISQAGGIVVSGGALGIDIIAHNVALPQTILISPASLDTIYPAFNAPIIKQIAESGLILSEYESNTQPKQYEFLHRNRLIIALSDIVIIPQADLKSGSMHSAKLSQTLQKPLFVFSHRIGESQGTQSLLQNNQAKPIYDIEAFLQEINLKKALNNAEITSDEILEFCKSNPIFEEAYLRFGESILEYEFEGKIMRQNGRLFIHNP